MRHLAITPEYLEELAKRQGAASKKAGEAATVASGIETAVWVTHGVISGVSNAAFTTAEKARHSAGVNIGATSADLAAKLRTAGETYAGVDDELGGNLNKQMLDP